MRFSRVLLLALFGAILMVGSVSASIVCEESEGLICGTSQVPCESAYDLDINLWPPYGNGAGQLAVYRNYRFQARYDQSVFCSNVVAVRSLHARAELLTGTALSVYVDPSYINVYVRTGGEAGPLGASYAANVPLSNQLLLGELEQMPPIAATARERIAIVRGWAEGRTVPAG